jgi:type II secretory pathway pseudopilin PulG
MKLRRHEAFTFVEILAALAFLGLLVPVIVSALSLSNRAGVIAERTLIATQLGENRLNEMLLGNAWSGGETRGDFGDEHPGYRWELTQTSWEAGSMTELSLDVIFQVQGQDHDVRLTTLVNEALTSTTSTAP